MIDINAVVTNDLTKKYGNKLALHAVNLELPVGGILGVMGPRGAGKTTLVKILAGLLPPTIGSASVFEYAVSERADKLHCVCGVAGGDIKLYEKLTMLENMFFFGKLSGLNVSDARERASQLLHALNIWAFKDTPVGKLSASAYKKLSVATAMVASPKLLILDDIAQDVDDRTVCEIYDFITEASQREDLSALVTSESAEYMSFCSSFALLSLGQIVSKGSYDRLMKTAELKYIASLKTADGNLNMPLDGFVRQENGCFTKRISAESEMSEIVERAVHLGNKLIQAKVIKPSLSEICEKLTEEDI